jgi:hypothetical protein
MPDLLVTVVEGLVEEGTDNILVEANISMRGYPPSGRMHVFFSIPWPGNEVQFYSALKSQSVAYMTAARPDASFGGNDKMYLISSFSVR